jgi:hypothetical protein
MIFPILLLLLAPQDNSRQVAEQTAQLNQLKQEVEKVTSELTRMQAMLQSDLKPTCSSESRLQSNGVKITEPSVPVRLNLFSVVSHPAESCLPAEIRITATYMDSSEVFVCSGNLGIIQATQVQNTLFELRPYEPEVFIRWWDGPTLRQQSLVCRNFQGDELRNPTDHASSVRIYVTALPKRGGMSTSEFQLSLPRFERSVN